MKIQHVIIAIMLFHLSAQAGDSIRLAQAPAKCESALGTAPDIAALLRSTNPSQAKPGDLDFLAQLRIKIKADIESSTTRIEDKVAMKRALVQLRELSDQMGMYLFPQIKISSLNYTKEPAPILEPQAYPAFSVNGKFGSFEFQDGDLLITKGVSLVSSSISSFSDNSSPFSHIAFVSKTADGKLQTIESYIGKGVSDYSMSEALKNENARIIVLRSKDKAMATRAAEWVRGRLATARQNNTYIPYDYVFDFNDGKALSCEEVAYEGYKMASKGEVIIPEIASEIIIKNPELGKKIGIKSGRIMMPADMESDPRFEVALDWTDYRIVRDSWRKDALMKVVLRMIDSGEYEFPKTIGTRMARLVWKTRNIDWLWNVTSFIARVDKNTTPDVPMDIVTTKASLAAIESKFLTSLQTADQQSFEKTGRWSSKEDLEKLAEKIIRERI